ncbi:unnamed protein product [Ranitomeya imitator]|uniref:Uncharacterized protein n=1 Tax=Ranitomeya imitator TaxID=111125 RepID=A0ABN9L4Q4_9NEOB|nr:unnamed protein product [Ranitomeya imitator]
MAREWTTIPRDPCLSQMTQLGLEEEGLGGRSWGESETKNSQEEKSVVSCWERRSTGDLPGPMLQGCCPPGYTHVAGENATLCYPLEQVASKTWRFLPALPPYKGLNPAAPSWCPENHPTVRDVP